LSSNTALGFGYGQALVGLLVGVWAYVLGRRLYPVSRGLYALCVTAIAVSPGQLGLSPFALTPGMTYNRFAYALLGLVLLECATSERGFELIEGLSTGVLLALLTFSKFTTGFAGALLVLSLMPASNARRRRLLGIGAGVVLASLPFLIYLHFDVADVIRDLAITAHAKRTHFIDVYILNTIARDFGIGAVFVWGAFGFLTRYGNTRAAQRTLSAGIAVLVASLFLIFTNFQQSELPLVPLLLLILADTVLANRIASSDPQGGGAKVIAGGALVFAVVTIASSFVSLLAGTWWKMHSARGAPHFDAPALRQFVCVGPDTSYTGFVNDGIELLTHDRRPGERVMSLDFTNPFSFGLWIPPAPGGSVNLQYDGTFNDEWKVSPETLFGASDLVMVPKAFTEVTLQTTVPAIYGPYLQSHFQFIGESTWWKLYRRSAPSPSGQ